MTFPTVDALERELRKLEAERQNVPHGTIPDDPVEFARSVGLEPERWQTEVLTSHHKAKILLCGRRTGKSTLAALVALHKALTCQNFDTIFVAPSLDQAQIPYLMAVSMYRYLGRPVRAISERRTGLELANGSELRAMAAVDRTKRGFSADLLVVDEASRVEEHAYYGGLLPSITRSAGYVMLMSTPHLSEGFFAETWHSGSRLHDGTLKTADEGEEREISVVGTDQWERTFVTSEDCEYFQRHPEKLLMVKSKVPEWYYRQEYLCEFLADEFNIFNPEDIAKAARAGEDLQTIEFEDDTW